MRFLNGSSQLSRTPKTAFAAALDIGIAALIALVLLRAMFFFELTLTPTITVLLTHAIPMETSTGIAVINASVFTRLVDVILSLITAICFMYLAQLYKRPYGITIALVLAVCDWAWYFWEVGGIQGMLNSEYGLLREVLVFMEAPIALWMSWYLRRITIGWSDRGSRLR
jgi:hypothetical protein